MQLLVHKDCKGNICMEEKQKKNLTGRLDSHLNLESTVTAEEM